MAAVERTPVPQEEGLSPAEAVERDTILRTLSAVVTPLASIIPGECEVVLHDLSLLPNSIIAIEGSLTGRSVNGPATDRLMQWVAQGRLETRIGYTGHSPEGRELNCSTIVARASNGTPVAALCINRDTQEWRSIAALAASMLPEARHGQGSEDGRPEHFAGDVDELAEDLLASAIESLDVPVQLMQKRHKMSVVAELDSSGFFTLRESVERAAQALGVTRFTIYNYLKELNHPGE